jgi:hypothetical protein
MHLSDRAHKLYARQTEQQQTHEALIKLSTASAVPDGPIASKEVLAQVEQQIQHDPEQATESAKKNWLKLPRWKLWSFCAAAAGAGAVVGYLAVWTTGWAGSVIIYQFLRLLYAIIRKAAPRCAAAEGGQVYSAENGTCHYQRNDKRILPMIVKLFFFLLLVLILLTVVVWHLTNL